MISFVASTIINITLLLNLLAVGQFPPVVVVDAFSSSSSPTSTTPRPPPSLAYQTSWEYNAEEKKTKKKRSNILSITDVAYIMDGGGSKHNHQQQQATCSTTIILAIASNDGTIRYLSYNTTATTNTDSSDSTPMLTEIQGMMMMHNKKNSTKPIFALDSIPVMMVETSSEDVPAVSAWPDNCYILSGSYDRSSTLSRITFLESISTKNQISAASDPTPSTNTFSSSWTLPEHTGWVRKVKLIQYNTETDDIITNNNKMQFDGCRSRQSLSNDDDDSEKVTGYMKENAVMNFCLSIGCNLVNVWIPATTTDVIGLDPESRDQSIPHQEEGTPPVAEAADPTTTSHRLARLDGGPSPNDTEEFRRHDIVSMEVLVLKSSSSNGNRNKKGNSIIVAGLVDGTLRAWKGRWNYWLQRRNENGEYVYDATGSCCNNLSSNVCSVEEGDQKGSQREKNDGSYDDKPCASVHAHEDRVIGIHACYYDEDSNGDENDATSNVGTFISVARNGCWGLWRIPTEEEEGNQGNNNANGFDLLSNGSMFSTDDFNADEQRICSSAVACFGTHAVLYAGTTNGRIYSVTIAKEETTSSSKRLAWKEDEEFNQEATTATSITSLHWINAPIMQDCKHLGYLFTGNSDGLLRCFEAVE